MKNLILMLFNAILLLPATVYAQVDFTQPIADHAMLILGIATPIAIIVAGVGKYLWDNALKKLDAAKQTLNNIENESVDQKLKLKEQVINQLERRVDKLELDQTMCNRALPTSYVTRSEYDKFTTQHREDINGITTRLENMIKEMKNEIKSDVQTQIDRIIKLMEEMYKG